MESALAKGDKQRRAICRAEYLMSPIQSDYKELEGEKLLG